MKAGGLAATGLFGCGGDDKAGSAGEGDGTPPAEGQIDHVIVVMMENRSFDHYLGALRLEEGREDIDGLTGDEINLGAEGETFGPFHLDENCQLDPPHSWGTSRDQFNDGANDGFVAAHEGGEVSESGQSGWVMGYYGRDDLPVHYTLADHFCVPNNFFSSVMGPTWPNRFFGHTGESMGQTGNTLPPSGLYTQRTIYQALQDVGEDWRYYYTDMPFIALLPGHLDHPGMRVVEEFHTDVAAGDLPAFTWIDPGFQYADDHPPHHIALGQLFIGLIYESLAASPLWDRCLLVITYDEHGGFYDHVPPPKLGDDRASEGFNQLGFRVPTIVAGPWVKQGTDDTVYDNTSVLRYVCDKYGIEPWNKRIRSTESIAGCLDLDRMASGVPLPAPPLPAFSAPEIEDLPDYCKYDISGPPPLESEGESHGQPELLAWIRANAPETERTAEIPKIHRHLLELGRSLGLVRGLGG
jgi:phospholipase C